MPYWDNHEVCRSCRNNSCSPSQTCEVCSLWDEELWRKFHKCLQRSDRLKKRNVPLPQVPENGPGLENTQHTALPNVSVTVSATDIGQHERNRNHESDSDSVTQAPGINVSNVNITRQVPSRSVTPMDVAFEGNRSVPRQFLSPRTDIQSQSRPPRSNPPTRRARHSRSSSSFDSGSSVESVLSWDPPRRKHTHTSRPRSKSPRPRHRSRSPRTRHRSRSPRHSKRYRSRSRSPRFRHPRVMSPKNTSTDPSVALLSELVKQQGDMLKKLSERMDTFSQNSSTVDKEKSLSSVDSGTEQNIDPCADQIQLCVGSNETIGVVSEDDDNEGELEVPKESLSYRDAIVKLRSRLGSEVCPTPEVTNKMSGTSALEFFKDPDQTATVSLALPQSNSVVESLVKMNKRLKGEEEIAMSPLPIYPKGFKPGSFVALNSKPRVFLPSSYEAINPHISLDPPSLNPGLKDVIKQGSAIPSSHNVQFSTLENWEKLARAGIQVASHSELFLCGTLKTIKNENLSKDDMLEVSRYLQAVAQSQSHLVEILSRLASGPLLARRDACLSVTDLDTECKQSLRVQPMESATIFGNKFPEVVSQYKESLAHKSLQMAVVNASKQQSSGFKNKDKKPSGYNSKGRPNTLSVTVGPGSSRTSNFSQVNRTARNARKNVNNQASFKSSKKGKGQKPSPP